MPVVITITNEMTTIDGSGISYNYFEYDRILKNVCKTEYEVFYSGQNKGRLDHQLIDAIQNNELFKVYYRPKKRMAYTYLGFTYSSDVIKYRIRPINIDTTTDERLQIHLVIKDIANITVPTCSNSSNGRFKKDVLIHAGLRDADDNSIMPHNKNTNIGFYYY